MQVINFRNGRSVMADRHIQGGQYSKTCIRSSGILAAMMVPSRQVWNLSSCLSSRLLKGLGLVTFVMLLLVGCGGGGSGGDTGGSGGGDGGGGDGGGGNGGDGTGEQVSIPAEVEWIVIPFDGGLRIQWDNVVNFSQAGVFVHLNLTGANSPRPIERRIPIGNFTNNSYEIAGLVNGTAYRLVGVAIEFADNTSRVIGIDWLWADNELNNNGSGIVVGPNYDNDSLADSVDTDDDNDGIDDVPDRCAMGETGWRSDNTTDNDGDGCRDRDEDADDDNDGLTDMADVAANCQFNPDCDNDEVLDGADSCVKGETGWQSNTTTDHDRDGCRDDSSEDTDDDNDRVDDGADICAKGETGWQSNTTTDYDRDGCRDDSSEDTDDDNDRVGDDADICAKGETGWQSNTTTDHDRDGCRDDSSEDTDDDNDEVGDGADICAKGETGWQSNATTDHDRDGCRDDSSEDMDDDNDRVDDDADICAEGETGWQSNATTDYDRDGCRDDSSEDTDDDNDRVGDNADSCAKGETGWQSNTTTDYDGDGCRDRDEDIDADGDGLIEIGTAAELDAVRHVLDGSGFKMTAGAQLNQTGCGNGADMMGCNGYELTRNISLTDYIAENYARVGWQPISPCDIGFTGTFDGNGFEVRGLFINRSQQDCIGLFGQVGGRDSGGGSIGGNIRNLGVIADRIEGNLRVGGLVGIIAFGSIVQSYAISNEVIGKAGRVGGLVGFGSDTLIVRSYAVSNSVSGGKMVGGLVGRGFGTPLVQSYAVTGSVSAAGGENPDADDGVGGLVGDGGLASIVQSYAVSNSLSGDNWVGGLVGGYTSDPIIHSYAVSGSVSGNNHLGGLVGVGGSDATLSYWDTETSSRTNSAVGSGQASNTLRSPTDYGDTGIYSSWDDGAISERTTIADVVDRDGTIWCDEDASGMIEDDERRDNNQVWDFGTTTDYPALRCAIDSPADQRAWWSLNNEGKPVLNQDRLNAYMAGTGP